MCGYALVRTIASWSQSRSLYYSETVYAFDSDSFVKS